MPQSLAFIVPFRERYRHLAEFIPHYSRRFRSAKIFIIEQSREAASSNAFAETGTMQPFNRGKLLNIGFLEAGKDFDYCAFHDVDMLCDKGNYSYPECPTHLATKVEQFRWGMPAPDYFGGVVLFNRFDFGLVGGYSNNFWGWGGEDNELYFRTLSCGLRIERRQCFYRSLYHPPAEPKGFVQEKMEQAKKPRAEDDGLAGCRYSVVEKVEFPLYTHLKVQL